MTNAVLAESLLTDADDIAARFGTGDFTAGRHKAERCLECHGDGVRVLKAPRLTGQYAGYLVKQLADFKSGERKHPVTEPLLAKFNEEDIDDISTYFAKDKTMLGKGGNANVVGQDLFVRGDLKRNIVPCKSCHGVSGKGSHSANDIYPTIAGQHKQYLQEQLINWRAGTRANSPSQVMNVIAKSLSDAEIEALAEYVSDMQ